jgi:hypothetical protein
VKGADVMMGVRGMTLVTGVADVEDPPSLDPTRDRPITIAVIVHPPLKIERMIVTTTSAAQPRAQQISARMPSAQLMGTR